MRSNHMRRNPSDPNRDRKGAVRADRRRALTRVEVVATTAATVLAVLVTTAGLRDAVARRESDGCLSNLRALGVAMRMYAEVHDDRLPGPTYLYASQNMLEHSATPNELYERERQLLWKLYLVLGDSISDQLITCPTLSWVNPQSSFDHFSAVTGRNAFTVHYALNSYTDTFPALYFGGLQFVPPSYYQSVPPARWGAVPNAAREWMLADAWYRVRGAPNPVELQLEGTARSSWTGEAMPYWAPHFSRVPRMYRYSATRATEAAAARARREDGVTNALFFDGHAAGVPSKRYLVNGFELLYGFRGTVNPAQIDPPPESPYWQGIWR